MTHICVSELTTIRSGNGLSLGPRQAIIWTNAEILLNGPVATNFSEILIEIHTISIKEMHLQMSTKWRPFFLGLNVLVNSTHIHKRIMTMSLKNIIGSQNILASDILVQNYVS